MFLPSLVLEVLLEQSKSSKHLTSFLRHYIGGLKIHQMDIKGAYLNGTLEEWVYMRQPEGFKDGTDCICKLLRSLYGLKQSIWPHIEHRIQSHNLEAWL